ncbi:ABC-F family ATP-binding cassette domain-containing protein [Erythrobacter sp. YT30]|uniref:ABC-F family ATP-binding cassette domain-containing protein n=1 Tax=Erythrobacter sp. YT30 TaxID=1735012 RepID=UPI00076D8558|nr:ABC-F family ATP-binding cassette domain-containing protein [Erythrobacter sp. YT30]KWV90483.1 ABC transporter [Erythrobacter sp. YT30]
MYITLSQISVQTPSRRQLFDNLTLSVGSERVGIVGRNGSGKSTLLRVIAGLVKPNSGSVTATGSIGLLKQDIPADWTAAHALGIAEEHAVLSRVIAGHGTGDDLENADWDLSARIDAALATCGLTDVSLERKIESFSGGERTRIGIARLMIEAHDFVLLDEPTNNLDRAGRDAVIDLVLNWHGGVIVASHDRALLESVDRIVALAPQSVRNFGGGWSEFEAARAEERERLAGEADRANAAAKSARREAQSRLENQAKRDKAGRATAAKGSDPKILLNKRAETAEKTTARGKALGDRAIVEADAKRKEAQSKVEIVTPLSIELPASDIPSGAQLVQLDQVEAAVGNRRLGPWTMRIDGPERVELRGANGSGKTTLLRIIAGFGSPAAGKVERAEGRIAMLDQHIGLLDPSKSVLENLRDHHPDLDNEAAHAACARFAFRNIEADRIVGSLSGGERLRAGLAVAFSALNPPWMLILDEPTNHLDIESLEVLESALRDHDGALLVVSHDVSFIERVGFDRIIEL